MYLLTHKDFLSIECYKSPNNGLTMCVGSYASRADNDVEAIVEEFVEQINFVHLRNVKKVEDSFVESHHLEGDVDMFKVISTLLDEQERRVKAGSNQGELGCFSHFRKIILQKLFSARLRLPFRPDHGHQMLDDLSNKEKRINPGYTLLGRFRGLAELRGLQQGVLKSKSLTTL